MNGGFGLNGGRESVGMQRREMQRIIQRDCPKGYIQRILYFNISSSIKDNCRKRENIEEK